MFERMNQENSSKKKLIRNKNFNEERPILSQESNVSVAELDDICSQKLKDLEKKEGRLGVDQMEVIHDSPNKSTRFVSKAAMAVVSAMKSGKKKGKNKFDSFVEANSGQNNFDLPVMQMSQKEKEQELERKRLEENQRLNEDTFDPEGRRIKQEKVDELNSVKQEKVDQINSFSQNNNNVAVPMESPKSSKKNENAGKTPAPSRAKSVSKTGGRTGRGKSRGRSVAKTPGRGKYELLKRERMPHLDKYDKRIASSGSISNVFLLNFLFDLEILLEKIKHSNKCENLQQKIILYKPQKTFKN